MKADRNLLSLVACLLVFIQLLGFNWKAFQLEGLDDVLVLDEDEEEGSSLQHRSHRRQQQENLDLANNNKTESRINNTDATTTEPTHELQDPIVPGEESTDRAENLTEVAAKDATIQTAESSKKGQKKENSTTKEEETRQPTKGKQKVDATHKISKTKHKQEEDDTGPLTCHYTTNKSGGPECCASWNVSADDWWTQHPHWQISLENETTYCFQKVPRRDQRKFLLDLHQIQWSNNCSGLVKSVELNSGYGASTGWLVQAFYYAYKQSDPFQIVNNTRPWLYAVTDPNHWAHCSGEDSRCYYLSISKCNRKENKSIKNEHYSAKPGKDNPQDQLEFHWIRQYLFRPRQQFRHKLYEMRAQVEPALAQNDHAGCVAMHVRRGDVGLPRPPFRRYAPVQEYIDAVPTLHKGDNVFLLTDDESTIQEVQKYLFKDYHWIYLDRPRQQNIRGGFDGHVPSGDPALELLAIETELHLAKQCHSLVYGMSGFMGNLIQDMDLEGYNYTQYYVRTQVSKAETQRLFRNQKKKRVATFFRDIDAFYAQRGIRPQV